MFLATSASSRLLLHIVFLFCQNGTEWNWNTIESRWRPGTEKKKCDPTTSHFHNNQPCAKGLEKPDLPTRTIARRYWFVLWPHDGFWGPNKYRFFTTFILPCQIFRGNISTSLSREVFGGNENVLLVLKHVANQIFKPFSLPLERKGTSIGISRRSFISLLLSLSTGQMD